MTEQRDLALLGGAAAIAAVILGALGPWATALGLVSVGGLDNWNDGWLLIAGAPFAGAALYRNWKDATRGGDDMVILGVLGIALCLYEQHHIRDNANNLIQVGWGLNLASAGVVGFAVAGVMVKPGVEQIEDERAAASDLEKVDESEMSAAPQKEPGD